MSRTKKGGKGPGYEFWSKRPGKGEYGGTDGSKYGKKLTHKAERREGKDVTKKEEE